ARVGDAEVLGGRRVVPGADAERGWVAQLVDGDNARTKRSEGVRFGQPVIATELLIAARHHVDDARVAEHHGVPVVGGDVPGRAADDEAEHGVRYELPRGIDFWE